MRPLHLLPLLGTTSNADGNFCLKDAAQPSCYSTAEQDVSPKGVRFEVPLVRSEPRLLAGNSSEIQGDEEKEKNMFRVAVLVLSGPNNLVERERIRKLRMPGFLLTFVFLIGQSGSREKEEELEVEEAKHHDLLRLEMEESYSGLPRKTLAGLTYVLSKLPGCDLVIKMDDDLEISPDNLKRALLASLPWQASTLYCYPLSGIPPHRRPWGQNAKLAVPKSIFPDRFFPDYCLGWLVATTPHTAEALLSQVPEAPAVHIDDVYITGILRQGANVSLAMLSSNPWFHSPLHTYVVNQCRFLTWAFHIFFYDIAYEPEGWPWKPIKTVPVAFEELLQMTDPSSKDFLENILFVLYFCCVFLCHLALLITIINAIIFILTTKRK